MATYRITAPDGAVYQITGDRAPTEQELNDMFNAPVNQSAQNENKNADFLNTVDKGLRTIGGAVEAFDRGKYLGFGKKAGGLANAVLSYPFDRAIEATTGKQMPRFGDRYNEIVEGAKGMYEDFSDKHPLAALGIEASGILTGAPAKIEKYATDRMAKAVANSNKYERAAGKIAALLGSGAVSSVGLGSGNADDISDYLTSKEALKEATLGASANAALGVAGQVGKAALKSVPKVSGVATGTSDNIVSRAFDAGRRKSETFLKNLRGNVEPERITVEAKNALRDMIDGNHDLYLQNIEAALKNNKKISPQNIFRDFTREINDRTLGGNRFLLRDDVKNVADKIEDLFVDFQKHPELHNSRGLDKLKQSVGAIAEKTKEGSQAEQLATKIRNSISDEISKNNPLYKKAMDTYATNIGEINEIRNTLSLRNNTNVDTTLRKLQSVGRNNVNTNYGYRNRLLKDLDFYGDIEDAIAGQALSSWKPRGTAGVVGGLNALSSAVNTVTNPTALPANLAYALGSSPRLTGEAAYKLGALADYLAKMRVGDVNIGSLASREKNK